ncbi:MAG: CHAT domain-containing protein [Caldilineaceae bacterium]|nr:CHAT domain-containing protein [Caldilineaceae bacterium]
MDRETLAAVLNQLWGELPTLIGADWPGIEPELRVYRAQLAHPETEAYAQVQLVKLLVAYPAAWTRLRNLAGENHLSAEKGLHPSRDVITGGGNSIYGETQPAPRTIRYTDVACPGRVWAQEERFTVVARLTHLPRSHDEERVKPVELDEVAPVFVQINAPNFTLLTPNRRRLTLHAAEDSEVSFDLSPREEGLHPIDVEYWQCGRPVETVRLMLEVTATSMTGASVRATSRSIPLGPEVEPPELLLQVTSAEVAGQARLYFTLFEGDVVSDLGFTPFTADPRAYAERLFARLEHLAQDADEANPALSAQQERELQQIGWRLWHQLTPQLLKDEYWRKREAWAGKALLLLSDEPYIPWELLWPYSPAEEVSDEHPWGVSLRMVRWLRSNGNDRGYPGPPAALRLSPMACIAPRVGLPMGPAEQEMVQALVQQHALSDLSPGDCTYDAVSALLETEDYAWLHVASHGYFDGGDPDAGACIELEGGALCADAICGPYIEGRIERNRPGVFLNTCHSGRQAWSVSRLGGWANAFIGSGAGLFIAPLWSVADDAAYRFAQAFYSALLDGKTVAEAARSSRGALYAPGDSTWLAYTVYAYPHARLAG